jgi:hypothetical protein
MWLKGVAERHIQTQKIFVEYRGIPNVYTWAPFGPTVAG